jgi:Sulfotransferase domain
MFWRELAAANRDALVLLSTRPTAAEWLHSLEATILPVARQALDSGWDQGRDLVTLFERFTGTSRWDDPATLTAAYERHNLDVRTTVSPERLLDWRAVDGWEPLCHALRVPAPDEPFPWTNRREDWG